MASKTLGSNTNDKDKVSKNPGSSNHEDDITERAGSNRVKNDEVEQEKIVKWQLPGVHDSTNAKKIVLNLIAALLMNHPQDVNFIDKKQREWIFNESNNEEKFLKEFDKAAVHMHPIKNKQQKVVRWVSTTKIVSSTNIQEWKNNDQFYSQMIEAKAYIFPHPFAEHEWDIVSVGFIKNIHAVHYPKELLHEQIHHMIRNQNKQPPTFQLIPQRITTNDKSASTKAYTVQCLKADAEQMIHMLTHGPFRNPQNQIFVPFKYKRTKPETFLKCIRRQNEVYYKTWIIKLEGITQETMTYIEQDISNIMGVWHIVPSKRVFDIGEWKILTDQTKCAYIHRQLSALWPHIISKVPKKTLDESPTTFSSPTISSKRAREYQDNDSDEDSYGSLLTTGTEISAISAEDSTLNEPPEEYKYPSYATAAAASTNSTEGTQISSPTNSAYTEWIKEKQELEAQLRMQAQQIEKIQADLQARISRSSDLEEQLAQAIDLAHSRDARHEEMLAKFEMLMNNQRAGYYGRGTYGELSTQENMLPTTPERSQESTIESPPPKKLNTNTSPHRNIYALFRQPQTRQGYQRQASSGRPNTSRKLTAVTASHAMDTDDDIHQPSPGAKSGHKKE